MAVLSRALFHIAAIMSYPEATVSNNCTHNTTSSLCHSLPGFRRRNFTLSQPILSADLKRQQQLNSELKMSDGEVSARFVLKKGNDQMNNASSLFKWYIDIIVIPISFSQMQYVHITKA